MTPAGRVVRGVRCPACRRTDGITQHSKKISGIQQVDIVLHGVLAWLLALAAVRSWVRCRHCGKVFRGRSSLSALSVVWLFAAGLVGFVVGVVVDPPGASREWWGDWARSHPALIPFAVMAGVLWVIGIVQEVRLRRVRRAWFECEAGSGNAGQDGEQV